MRTFLAAIVVCALSGAAAARQPEHPNVPREQWQRVDAVFRALGVEPGGHIADIGAGYGFFTTRLSKAVGASGRVYAVDVNPISVRELRDVLGSDHPNVEVIRGDENDPHLPMSRLDGVLIVNAYHEFAEYGAMLERIGAALRPDGRLVLIEPIPTRAEDSTRAAQTRRHTIAIELVEADLTQAGFEIVSKDPAFVTRPMHHGEIKPTDWLLVARRPGDAPSF